MMSVREHIYRLYCFHTIFLVKQGYVTSLSGGIAAHIDNSAWLGIQYHLYHILVHTSARRVYYHHVGDAMLGHKLASEHILHVAGIE